MMFDVISEMDRHALTINEPRLDADIYELDLSIWTIAAQLCRNAPNVAQRQFGLCDHAIAALASTDDVRLSRLASAVLLSFRLHTSQEDVCNYLRECRPAPMGFASRPHAEFDVAYWLAMKHAARQDTAIAAVQFGVKESVTECVASATDNSLRRMSSTLPIAYTLRFDAALVAPILQANKQRALMMLLSRKYQQILMTK